VRATISMRQKEGRTVPELNPASAATAPDGSNSRWTSGGRCCGTARLDLFPLPN
jgi:hypothetical protein